MKMIFREISAAEFAEFVKTCPNVSYMQSLPMFERYQKIGRECYLLGVFKGAHLAAAGLASVIYERFSRKLFTFSRGPLCDFAKDHDAFLYLLKEAKPFLREKSGIVLQISPSLLMPDAPVGFQADLKAAGYKYLGEYEQVKWVYALSFNKIEKLPPVKLRLRPDAKHSEVLSPNLTLEQEDKLLRSFRRDHRYTIKYATDRYGLRLREPPVEEYGILLKLIEESGAVHGFVPRDLKFFEQMKDAFRNDVAAIVAETKDGTPVAAAFFILYGDEVIYLSSGLAREHKKLGGPHLIQSALIKYAYANGYKKYNFWGTNPDPENGVYKFKQGFHGEVEEFVGTFAAPLDLLGRIYLAKIRPAQHRELQ
ncbi:peptidoglycan bridge formation glycyltransferase FemA/FemB family protein [Candidatus Saccharibacteria bacterium]|nr:peptidoglycan bridge formation glycyltransferase FemA/FemB family protein [Candidatus Saccharibacteria bacterium]